MNLKVFYSGKDFFGHFDSMLECECHYASVKDLRTALRHMAKDNCCAIHIDNNLSVIWNSYTDFENGVVTVRKYANWNSYTDTKAAFDKVKKDLIKEYTTEENEEKTA